MISVPVLGGLHGLRFPGGLVRTPRGRRVEATPSLLTLQEKQINLESDKIGSFPYFYGPVTYSLLTGSHML